VGVLRFGANLPSAIGFDFATGLRDVTGLAVAVDNDATCAAWGEHRRGASADARSSLMVTLGTGIGAGIATDDVLFRGAYGFAGEPGHMMVDPNGPPCPCGRRGCWERYGSGSGLARLAREAAIAGQVPEVVARAGGDPQDVRGEHVTAAAADGDDSAIEVIAQFGWWVAVGIANLVNVLDVETVVVGGGLVAAGDLILGPVRTAYPDLVYGGQRRPDVPIKPAVLGERAGAIGAALLAADRARQKTGVEAPSG
ncbi:MAG: ROK family protein, partial [Acidimicrobiales bacterium]